ncbi:hypothetical protein D0C16_05420 [Cellvibrio sp. KY-GH-1]|uniref:hypothetical protein n=1 Tax=Cellvibrio sp. KY-GH-1 TaxID=2303332 RepID=UPI0012439FA2|nr:hypothetical protein [Cellvibrio sp. KY-GH-1]QEY15462.1 hypothetical protein D0C16_05420 [Cellvibrio sp. KY-GH-1]
MRYIKPINIGDDQLVSSNVAETSPALWSSVEDYVTGDQVRVGHVVYKAASNNTNKAPADDANRAVWPVFGVTNRWHMFDMTRGSEIQTENSESIVVEIEPGELYSSLALFGLSAKTLLIEIIDDGSLVWSSENISLQSTQGINYFFAWFNAPIQRKEQFVTFSLPYYSGAVVRVTISRPGGVAKCGKLVIGWGRELGCTKWGLQPRYQDFSDIRYDTFGNLKLNKRRKARQRDFIVVVDSSRLAFVESQLISLGGDPTVFVGSPNHEISIILGVVSDFSSTYEFGKSNYNLKILGL